MSRITHLSLVMVLFGAAGCGKGKEPSKADIKVIPETASKPIVLPSMVESEKPTPTQTLGPVTAEPLKEVEKGPVPSTYREFVKVGKERMNGGQLDEALTYFEQAATLKPDYLTPQLELARVHLARGNTEAARPYADRAVEIDEHNSAVWNTKGRVELAAGNVDDAILAFERATEENPDNSHAWNNLGYLYIKQKKYEEAATALESATTGTQVTGYMWNNLGMAYEHLNRLDEARAAYRRGAEAGSDRADASLSRLQGVTTVMTE